LKAAHTFERGDDKMTKIRYARPSYTADFFTRGLLILAISDWGHQQISDFSHEGGDCLNMLRGLSAFR
jgi:hypothetical protein